MRCITIVKYMYIFLIFLFTGFKIVDVQKILQ